MKVHHTFRAWEGFTLREDQYTSTVLSFLISVITLRNFTKFELKYGQVIVIFGAKLQQYECRSCYKNGVNTFNTNFCTFTLLGGGESLCLYCSSFVHGP